MRIEGEIRGGTEFVAKLRGFTEAARPNVRNAVVRMQYQLQRAIKALLSGDALHVRSGVLRDATTVGDLVESDERISGPVGNNTIYGPAQNYGATITPKNVDFLTIPLEAALTAAGVTRWSARQIIEDPGQGGYIGTFKPRNMDIIFGKLAGGGYEPLFVLRTEVVLPPRPFMEPALASVQGDFEDALTDALEQAKNAVGL